MFPLVLLAAGACDRSDQTREKELRNRLAAATTEARAALRRGRSDYAVQVLRAAIAEAPKEPSLYLLLSEAYQSMGNATAAVLAIDQARAASGRDDSSFVRAKADLCRQMRQVGCAIAELSTLRERQELSQPEVLELARLMAAAGRTDEAMATLDQVLVRSPDDPDAKTVEAEIMLRLGKELEAGTLLDRLVKEHPTLVRARIVRARYFLNVGNPKDADLDLSALPPTDELRLELTTLRVLILLALERHQDAAAVLEPVVRDMPRDADLMALTAQVRLQQQKPDEAATWVSKALQLQPALPRALFVRGLIAQARGDARQAEADFEAALRADPRFVPAHRALWQAAARRGDRLAAMASLERLIGMGEADFEERVALARLCAETGRSVGRGLKLAEEALAREPGSEALKALVVQLKKLRGPAHKPAVADGPVIMRPRGR